MAVVVVLVAVGVVLAALVVVVVVAVVALAALVVESWQELPAQMGFAAVAPGVIAAPATLTPNRTTKDVIAKILGTGSGLPGGL